MKKITLLVIAAYLVFQLVFSMVSCTNDELPKPDISAACDTLLPTYNNMVKDIIDNSCAYSGCHSPGGIGVGIYNNYSSLISVLNNGSFKNRVFDLKSDALLGMPPDNSAYPESQKDDLTEEELIILQCWLNAGYPEN